LAAGNLARAGEQGGERTIDDLVRSTERGILVEHDPEIGYVSRSELIVARSGYTHLFSVKEKPLQANEWVILDHF
jgi:hypothetical protein